MLGPRASPAQWERARILYLEGRVESPLQNEHLQGRELFEEQVFWSSRLSSFYNRVWF